MLPDPLTIARRLLDRAERELVERVIEAGSSAAAAAAGAVRGQFLLKIQEFMTLLGKLPHGTANWILDLDRGFSARSLTRTETQLVQEAFGGRINPGDVRIVRGAGLSAWAAIAFRNGNPAITLGNTIYIKSDLKDLTHSDLSLALRGIEMLLHEYTHVVQYATLGFGTFGRRYASELRSHGWDANKLYDYGKRNSDWQHETLEGQAQIVGEYGTARRALNVPRNRALADRLRAKLQGTGIYAQ
ncbi:hypothetical protein [Sphingomonas sp. S2-65]|uniref:hypothetical protein n=1 Tax=Sphingomonas sp. S2-65 TaxID=2903960 RepID=UPI001F47F20F|nr:hypothetical protein [Sphingomonas sp. S2-65]UYY57687.1 hypothetical protein LZ586_13605 [Sphingomonas sp. S2-65]